MITHSINLQTLVSRLAQSGFAQSPLTSSSIPPFIFATDVAGTASGVGGAFIVLGQVQTLTVRGEGGGRSPGRFLLLPFTQVNGHCTFVSELRSHSITSRTRARDVGEKRERDVKSNCSINSRRIINRAWEGGKERERERDVEGKEMSREKDVEEKVRREQL